MISSLFQQRKNHPSEPVRALTTVEDPASGFVLFRVRQGAVTAEATLDREQVANLVRVLGCRPPGVR